MDGCDRDGVSRCRIGTVLILSVASAPAARLTARSICHDTFAEKNIVVDVAKSALVAIATATILAAPMDANAGVQLTKVEGA
jgi:hypothetical protein